MTKDRAEELAYQVISTIELADENGEEGFEGSPDLGEYLGYSSHYMHQVMAFIHSDEWDGPEVFYEFYSPNEEGRRFLTTEVINAKAWKDHRKHAAACKQGTGSNQVANFMNVTEGHSAGEGHKAGHYLRQYRNQIAKRFAEEQNDDPRLSISNRIAALLTPRERDEMKTRLENELKVLTA